MSVLDLVLSALGQEQTQNLARKVGAEPAKVQDGVQAALPLLLGALTRNAQDPQGAQELHRELERHDGTAIEEFKSGRTPDIDEGNKILSHVLGNRTDNAAKAVSDRSGLDMQSAMKLLAALAPIVLGALGKQKQQSGFDVGGLVSMLGQEREKIPHKMPGLLDAIDKDGDGPLDDIGGLLGGLGRKK